MLAILSPAKTLDFSSPLPTRKHSEPRFLAESEQLIDTLRRQPPHGLASLMRISDKLAETNHRRYLEWHRPFTPDNARPAILAFKGDVYLGLDAGAYSERDFTHAQKHLRILSGLHGLLRPLDLIQPYRLEMGTALANPRGQDLFAFWGNRVTRALNEDLAEERRPLLINLASNEYFNVIDPDAIEAPIITPTFKELHNGRYRFMSFYGKRARGLMATYLVRERVRTLRALKAFDWEGYRFCEAESTEFDWVFLRDKRP